MISYQNIFSFQFVILNISSVSFDNYIFCQFFQLIAMIHHCWEMSHFSIHCILLQIKRASLVQWLHVKSQLSPPPTPTPWWKVENTPLHHCDIFPFSTPTMSVAAPTEITTV